MFKKISSLIVTVLFLVLQVPFFVLPVSAAIDTCTWTGGGTDNLWTTATNWSCSVDGVAAPEDYDTLVFPDVASRKTNVNDFVAGKIFDNILISGNDYVMTGNAIDLSPTSSILLSMNGNNNNFGIDATLNGSSSKSLSSTGANNVISGNLILNLTGGADMNVGSAGANTLQINGIISGSTDGFIISNGGTVEYNGASNFTATGVLQINQGAIASCGDDACLGNSSNDLVTYGDAQFITTGVRTIPYSITTNIGTGNPTIEAQDTLTLTGAIDINTDTTLSETNVAYKLITASSGGINIDDNKNLNLLGGGNYLDSRFIISGLTGTGDLSVTGGELSLNSNTSYDGDIFIKSGGFLNSPQQTGLGTTVGGVIIENGGVLRNGIVGSVTLDDNITVEGIGNPTGYYGDAAIYNEGEDQTFTGTVTLSNDATILNTSDTHPTIFSGRITGIGVLTFNGDDTNGGITLSGSTANDYIGTTLINSINVTVSKSANVIAIPGDAVVTAVPVHTARILTTADEQIADDSTIALDSDASTGALVISGGHHETVGTVTGDGLIDLGGASDELFVGGGNKSGVFTGQVLGANGSVIHKIGTGTWNFQGTNDTDFATYANYDVIQGKFLANPANVSLGNSNFSVNGGILGGTGITGPVAVNNGSVSPGNSPGCLNPNGTLAFSTSSTLTIEIAGSTICTQYDKVAASGAVTLGNATLSINPSYTPDANAVFTIVEGSTVSGIFNGLPDGSTITANGLTFRVNYTASSVTLTYLKGALATTGSNSYRNQAIITFLASITILGIVIKKRNAIKFVLNKKQTTL